MGSTNATNVVLCVAVGVLYVGLIFFLNMCMKLLCETPHDDSRLVAHQLEGAFHRRTFDAEEDRIELEAIRDVRRQREQRQQQQQQNQQPDKHLRQPQSIIDKHQSRPKRERAQPTKIVSNQLAKTNTRGFVHHSSPEADCIQEVVVQV